MTKTMFIEDEELRLLYRDASQEHLEKLEAGVLKLEKHPDDVEQLKALLREAHSLKGDSRMLGVQTAETLTHHIEDLLIAVDQEELTVTSELCDRIYKGLDAVRKVAHEAVTGEPSGINTFNVVAELIGMDAGPLPEEASPSEPSLFEEVANADEIPDLGSNGDDQPYVPAGLDLSMLDPELAAALGDVPASQSPLTDDDLPLEILAEETFPEAAVSEPVTPQTDSYQIDTIRVAAPQLDQLVTQAGELAVTKLRIARRMDDFGALLRLWETWSRENLSQRTALNSIARQIDPGLIAPLQQAQHQHEQHLEQLGDLIRELRGTAVADTARLEAVANDIESGILELRMLPLSNLFNLFPRLVRDLAKDQGKEIDLVIEGGDTLADKRILEEMKAPLTHMIRNAIDHGIESLGDRLTAEKNAQATVRLRGYQMGSSICIEVIDDGRGLDLEQIKQTALRRGLYSDDELARMSSDQIQSLIFEPGFSTRTRVSELSGRGVGLDVVRTHVDRLKGSIQVVSVPERGCTFRFTLGGSLSTTYALIVSVNATPYAIPVEFVDTMIQVQRQDIFTVDGNPTITLQGQPLSIAWLSELLALSASTPSQQNESNPLSCVVLKVGSERLGLVVDALIEQQDIVLKPQSKLLQRVRNIAGATILGDGDICMVLNAQDLIHCVRGDIPAASLVETTSVQRSVLLVEDSVPIRTQVRRILQGAGYDVTEAVDGLDGFEKLSLGTFDAVVSDIEMPNLNGFELTRQIRTQTEYEMLPVILVSTLSSPEDRQRGTDAGASAYITKGDFDQTLLLDTLRRLI